MPYRITGICPDGAVSFRSKTPSEALETANELIGFGLEEVSITDASGHLHALSDFERLYGGKPLCLKADG